MYAGLLVVILLILIWIDHRKPASFSVRNVVDNVNRGVKRLAGYEKYDAGVQWAGNTTRKDNFSPGVTWIGNAAPREHYEQGPSWAGNTVLPKPPPAGFNTKLGQQEGMAWAGANTPSGLSVGKGQGVGQGTVWQSYM